MSDDEFPGVEERIRKFELSELHPAEAWEQFFTDSVALLGHSDHQKKEYAIERLQKGIWAERMQQYRQPGFQAPVAEQRMTPILNAISHQNERDELLLCFTMWSSFTEEQKSVFSRWLSEVAIAKKISEDTSLISKIQAELYTRGDWNQAKLFVEPLFDHPNDLVRAAAAAAFGSMYSDEAKNLPSLRSTVEQIKLREIERPGFAGAFIGQVRMMLCDDGGIGDSGIKLQDWMLEIIARRRAPEPVVRFYNGIDFHAHEVLSGSADAVRKLLEFGAESVAAMAATEEDRRIVGMESILEELSYSSDYLTSRICSWHLADVYRVLHPEAERRGFVRLVERDNVDIFLVFDPHEIGEQPFSATIHPRASVLSDDVAWQWVDKLIPPDLRNSTDANERFFPNPEIDADETMYDFGSYIVSFHGDCTQKKWDRVWIKWPFPDTKW